MIEADLERAAVALRGAKRVAALTGAGVSAESGVPTFRASDGLWEGHRIEEVATPEGWRRNPKLVWEFYNARRANVRTVSPNPGHVALAELERRFGENFTLATQNVDGLHRAAGSKRVFEVHGSLHRTRCTGCGEVTDRGLEPLSDAPACPACAAPLRPDIVWFGEMLPDDVWAEAQRAAFRCDVFLVIGTSAVVHPAAGLVHAAKRNGANDGLGATVIEVNLMRTEASHFADIGLYGKSGEILPRLLDLLARG